MKNLAVTGVEHPAVKVWAAVRMGWGLGAVPVEPLQKRTKGTVYRLIGAGPSRSDVVAKRSSRERIAREASAYEVLAELPVSAVHYYGTVPDAGGEDWWLFVSYAGRDNYSFELPEHRALAARWLAGLHTSSTAAPPAGRVSDRSPGYYLGQLERGREEILEHVAHPALDRRDVELLETIVRQCEILASRWREVERICALIPPAFVHGDFAPKNIRVADDGAPRLLAFDWANGGWGVPAVDLPQPELAPSTYWANPDLEIYLASVASRWPQLTRNELLANAAVGKMLRSVVCIRLDAVGLATDWPHGAMERMHYYQADMRDAFHALRWDP